MKVDDSSAWLCLLSLDKSVAHGNHFFNVYLFFFCFLTFLSPILTFPCLWQMSFFNQIILEPLIAYWASIESLSNHFIICFYSDGAWKELKGWSLPGTLFSSV